MECLNCLVSLKVFACRLQVEGYGTPDVCFAVYACSFCVMLGLGWFCLDAIHSMVEAMSLAVVLLRV